MKKLFRNVVITVMFSIGAQMANASTVTFNEPGLTAGFGPTPIFPGTPKGTTPITDQFADSGVIFSIDTNGVSYISSPSFVGGLAGPSGGNVLTVNTVTSTATKLTATFVDPAGTGTLATVDASSFSVFVSDTNSFPDSRVIVRSFGANGIELEEQILKSLGETLSFSVGNIARVEFLDNGNDGHTIDDFSFGSVSLVPVPPAIILFGSGLVGLAAWSERKKTKKVVLGGV